MGRVAVVMSDKCHRVLKQYAAYMGMTMSDCMYQAMRTHLHTLAKTNEQVRHMILAQGIELDNV